MTRSTRSVTWAFAGAAALLVVLASHKSVQPQILGRYSLSYSAFLLVCSLSLVAAYVLYRRGYPRRLAGVAARLREVRPADVAAGRYRQLILGASLLHFVLVFFYLSPLRVISPEPILRMDYAHHFHQVATVVEALATEGQPWAYDPSFCAGYPAGTLFDVDMKLIELMAYLLTWSGLDLGLVYNCLILSFFLAVPAVLWRSCRNFELTPAGTVAALFAGVLFWHSYRMILVFNSSGVSFVFASYWTLLSASLLYRCLRQPRASTYFWLGAALAIGLAIHITSPILLVGPMAAVYFRRWREVSLKQNILLAFLVVAATALNSWWIAAVVRFYPMRVVTAFWEAPRISELLASFLDFETVDLTLAVLGMWGFFALRATHKSLSVVGMVSVAYFYALANLTGGVPWLNTLEVGRFAVPFGIFAMLGLSVAVAEAVAGYRLGELSARTSLPVLLISLLFAAQLLVPRTLIDDGFGSARAAYAPLVSWLEEHTTRDARVAYLDDSPGPVTGAKLRFYLDREIIGGPFSQLNMVHSYASFTPNRFFDVSLLEVTREDLARYAERFNIKWLVATTDETCAIFSALAPVATQVEQFSPRRLSDTGGAISPFKRFWQVRGRLRFCVFEIDRQADFFERGSGRVSARLNRIEVRGASRGGLVLRYHWLDTLATDPPLPLREHRIEGQPVGFIAVDNGETANFVVYNSYRWPKS